MKTSRGATGGTLKLKSKKVFPVSLKKKTFKNKFKKPSGGVNLWRRQLRQ
jgi:hypothetical protein